MKDIGYPLDLLTPVRHVVTEIERAAPAALSIDTMAATYRHPNTGDLARVRSEEGARDDDAANRWLIERAVGEIEVRAGRRSHGLTENGHGGYRLAEGTTLENLRFRRKAVRLLPPPPMLGDRFNPQAGEWSENIPGRTLGDLSELVDSMERYGWLSELGLAIQDERGVLLVGHRRVAAAQKANPPVEPKIRTIDFGRGDDADVERAKFAIASNMGMKPLGTKARQKIAEYLIREREYTQAKAAEVVGVDQATVSRDLRDIMQPHNVVDSLGRKKNQGRKRKLTPGEEQVFIHAHFEEGKHLNVAEAEARGWDEPKPTPSTPAKTIAAEERARRELLEKQAEAATHACPECGAVHPIGG